MMNAYNDMLANVARINQNSSVHPVGGVPLNRKVELPAETQTSFNEVLQDKISEINSLQFSKHAALRIHSRDVTLSPEQLERVEEGVLEARQKGIKDSLVLVDGVALLVNVPSRTVVTAMNQSSQNVFTNIDGTVIV